MELKFLSAITHSLYGRKITLTRKVMATLNTLKEVNFHSNIDYICIPHRKYDHECCEENLALKLPVIKFTLSAYFSAAHRLYSRCLSRKANRTIFGKCNHIHGHNYKVQVTVQGQVSEETGMVIKSENLKLIIDKVINEIDHKNIDQDIDYFKTRPSTVENVSIFFWDRLHNQLPNTIKLTNITIYETKNNVAHYRGN